MQFEFYIPTTKTLEEFEKSDCFTSLKSIKSDKNNRLIIKPICENKTGLSELYNKILKESTADYVVFIHDDFLVQDSMVLKKLAAAHEHFDIVGLAGASSQDYSDKVARDGKTFVPLVWHHRRLQPQDGRGFVAHYIPENLVGNNKMHVNSTYFGPTPARVTVIDGVFMSFKKETVKIDIFDEDFSFHFYDMAMCVNAIKNNLKIGVWPIFGLHYGLGEFANDPTWIKLQPKFREKFLNHSIKVE